jgi:hypothetical protein
MLILDMSRQYPLVILPLGEVRLHTSLANFADHLSVINQDISSNDHILPDISNGIPGFAYG